MARPMLGSAKRTIVASVRITEAEEQMLTALGGDKNKGLRRLIDLQGSTAGKLDIPESIDTTRLDFARDVAAAMREPLDPGHVSAPPSQGKVTHRHRRGEVLRTEMDKGVEVTIYRCAGCEKELR